jgi:hypothetical protein
MVKKARAIRLSGFFELIRMNPSAYLLERLRNGAAAMA